jgi:hypothetical protein
MGLHPKEEVAEGEYLLQRAEAEVGIADAAASPHAAEAHRALARVYLGRLFGDETEQQRWRPSDEDDDRDEVRRMFLQRLGDGLDEQGALADCSGFGDLLARL